VPWEQLQEIGNNLAIAHRIAYERERLELPREAVPPFPDLADYNALITDCFQEDPCARPKMEAVLERLVGLQQRIIRRQSEAEAAAAANGGATKAAQSVLASPSRSLSAATRRASNAAAVAAASAAHWRDAVLTPSRTWMLVAGMPVLTAMLSWAIARRIYSQGNR